MAGKAAVPVEEAVLEGVPFPDPFQKMSLRKPRVPAILEGTAQVEVAAVIADGNGRPDIADFPAANVAQCGHNLANKGVEPFGTVIGISLDRHVIPLLSQPPLP